MQIIKKHFAFLIIVTVIISQFSCIGILANSDIKPYGDTYVDFAKTANNNCSAKKLFVSGNADDKKTAFLLFSFDKEVGEDKNVVLNLKAENITGADEANIAVYTVSDNDIPDAQISAASYPAQKTLLKNVTLEKGKASNVEVTNLVNEVSARKNIILALVGLDKTICEFNSIESGESSFYLSIVDKVKEPEKVEETEKEEKKEDASADQADQNAIRGAQVTQKALPKFPQNGYDKNIADYTTTYYKPYIANYHFTEPIQLENDYRGGEGGQRMLSATVSDVNPNRILLGYDTEGIFRSEDGGRTWVSSSDGLQRVSVVSVEFYPGSEDIVFANICGINTSSKAATIGIYKSVDGGKNWKQVKSFLNAYSQHYDLIDFSDVKKNGNRSVYVGSYNGAGLTVSDDVGETWKNIGNFEGKIITNVSTVSNTIIVSTQGEGIFVSEDEGITWERRMNGIKGVEKDGVETFYTSCTKADPYNHNNWYTISDSNIYESLDRGKIWNLITTSKDIFGKNAEMWILHFGPGTEEGKARMYTITSSVYWTLRFSEDYGRTFQKSEIHNNLAWFEDNWGWGSQPVITHPTNPDIIWVALQDEFYKSVDGAKNLYPSCSGMSGHRVNQFWVNPDNYSDMMMACTDYGILLTVPSGNGEKYPLVTNYPSEDKFWIREWSARSATGVAADPRDRNRILICIGGWTKGVIKESTDGGVTFHKLEGTEAENQRIFFNKNNPDIIYCGSRVSHDNGKTWEKSALVIRTVCPVNNDIVYAHQGGNVYKSSDCGRNWEMIAANVGNAQGLVADLEIVDRLYVGTYNEGLTIVDNGTITNIGVSNGLGKGVSSSFGFYYVAQNPKNPNHLVTCGQDQVNYGPSGGIYESFDRGNTWRHVDGMPASADAWNVTFHPDGERVFISTSLGTFSYETNKYYDMSEKIYLDVSDETTYATEEIELLFNKKISNQYHNGYFNPSKTMQRYEFFKWVTNLLEYNIFAYNQQFNDVDVFNRYFLDTAALYDMGIIAPDENMNLRLYEDITYKEAMQIMTRILRYKKLYHDEIKIGETNSYDYDVLKYFGIIPNEKEFANNQAASREDLAYMFAKLVLLTE